MTKRQINLLASWVAFGATLAYPSTPDWLFAAICVWVSISTLIICRQEDDDDETEEMR